MSGLTGPLFRKRFFHLFMIGFVPAVLASVRLVTFSHTQVEESLRGQEMPPEMMERISSLLFQEAWAIVAYVVLGVGLCALLIAKAQTKPIKQILRIAESARSGELHAPIEVHTGDEIEELALQISQTGKELAQLQKEINTRVIERTRDLERRTFQLQTAAEVARDATATQKLEDLLNHAVRSIQERFDFYHVGIFLKDQTGEQTVLKAAAGPSSKAYLERGARYKVGDIGIVNQVAHTGGIRIINDVNVDFTYVRDPVLPETKSEVAFPLSAGEKIIGILDVQRREVHGFEQDDITVLKIVSDQLAVAIQNLLTMEELQTNLQEMRTLYQRFTRESWLRSVPEKPKGYEYDLFRVLPTDSYLPVEVLERLKTGRAVIIRSDQEDVGGVIKSHPVLVAPLMMHNQLVGVIGFEEEDPDYEWSADEISMVESLTNQISLALDNARLIEETQLRTDQLRLLQEITAAAAAHIHLDALMEDVTQRIVEGFDLLHCGVVLFDPGAKSGTLVADASSHPDAPGAGLVGAKLSFEGNDLTQHVIDTRRSLVIYDVQSNPQTGAIHDLMKERGAQTLVITPLISRGEVIGTIGLDIAEPDRRISDDELRLLDQISMQIAASIDIARSFEQTAKRAELEKLVSAITGRMRESLDIETVLQTAAREMHSILGLEEVTVYLKSDVEDEELLAETFTSQSSPPISGSKPGGNGRNKAYEEPSE